MCSLRCVKLSFCCLCVGFGVALADPWLGAVCWELPTPLTRALLLFLLQIGDRSGELAAQLNMAQLRAALGLSPGEEDGAAAHPYSGYEAQGEFLGFWWHWEFFGVFARGQEIQVLEQDKAVECLHH